MPSLRDPTARRTLGRTVGLRWPVGHPRGDLVRDLKPSLARMLATCRAAVVGLTDSSAAMALLLRPVAIRAAISCSRGVSELGGADATS